MLAVLDVSGSMIEKGANGQTRIETAKEAALTALAMLPDTSQIGLWAFSTDKKPPNDWIELVPIGPLGEPIAGVTRRQALQAGVGQLPSLVGGGTALNDTTLAAFRHVLQGLRPVEGQLGGADHRRHATTTSRRSTRTLWSRRCKRESDPARPVPLIMVGLGQEADMDALRKIAKATGGKAYQTFRSEDIRAVLLDAISQRRCRPNC